MTEHDHITEQKRLEATALVASRVSREEATLRVRHERTLSIVRDVVIAVLMVAVAVLAIRNLTESKRTRNAVIAFAQANCQQYHDVATIPLEPDTTTVGLHLVADFRNSYYAYKCENRHGELPPPDKRLLPYLRPEARG